MKRILSSPDPEHQPSRIAEEYSLVTMPLDILKYVCQFLGPKDACSVIQTHSNRYYSVRENELFWQWFFNCYYYSSSPKQPEQSWLEACKEQHQFLYNMIAGRCTVKMIPIRETIPIVCLARDEKGRFIIGYSGGEVRVWDPKTKDSVTLQPSEKGLRVRKIVYEEGLCVVQWNQKIVVWDLATTPPKEIYAFECELPRVIDTEIKLIGKRLLIQNTNRDWNYEEICRYEAPDEHPFADTEIVLLGERFYKRCIYRNTQEHPCIIEIVDLKLEKESIVLSFDFFLVKATVFDNYLFFIVKEEDKVKVCVWDLETEIYKHAFVIENRLVDFDSLEMHYFSENCLFCFTSESDLIYKYDLGNFDNSRRFSLWKYPGIPSGFCWGKDHELPCSRKELSFLFHKCTYKQFIYLEEHSGGGKSIKSFMPGRIFHSAVPAIFHQGKLFRLSDDGDEILCFDFTASIKDVLNQIVELLEKIETADVRSVETGGGSSVETESESAREAEDESSVSLEDETAVGYALRLLNRMPQPVQNAILGIYGKVEEGGWVDPNRIKEAILDYLSSNYSNIINKTKKE